MANLIPASLVAPPTANTAGALAALLQASQARTAGLGGIVDATKGITDRAAKELEQKNKQIEQQRLADALALQQQEAKTLASYRQDSLGLREKELELKEQDYIDDMTRQARADYTNNMLARIAAVPQGQRQSLYDEIMAKEGGFMPQGQTLSSFASLMEKPEQEKFGTRSLYGADGSEVKAYSLEEYAEYVARGMTPVKPGTTSGGSESKNPMVPWNELNIMSSDDKELEREVQQKLADITMSSNNDSAAIKKSGELLLKDVRERQQAVAKETKEKQKKEAKEIATSAYTMKDAEIAVSPSTLENAEERAMFAKKYGNNNWKELIEDLYKIGKGNEVQAIVSDSSKGTDDFLPTFGILSSDKETLLNELAEVNARELLGLSPTTTTKQPLNSVKTRQQMIRGYYNPLSSP